MNREIEIERFNVRAEDGQEYTIVVFQQFISAAHLTDPQAEIPGSKRLVTNTGLPVSYVNAETFEIVGVGQVVREA
jgi:hypothetical protein